MADLEQLNTESLLSQALAAAHPDPMSDDTELLAYVCELIRRPEPLVFQTAAAWCGSDSIAAQGLGASVLSELGFGAEPSLPFRAQSMEILRRLLTDPKPPVVAAAVIALGRLGLNEDLSLVVSLAGHDTAIVRHAVAVALGGLDSPEAIDALIALTLDNSSDVRDWAAFGLGTLCDVDTPRLREALWARVDDPDYETRIEAQLGLARRSDRRVLDHVQAALRAESVGTLSVEAAGELATPELLSALEELREWWDVDNELLTEAIVKCGGAAAY